jgi:hypothetical protein|tara:strand:- start:135 stop:488 length:354 start_codon:yes stop_codon:yes gene_type:complete
MNVFKYNPEDFLIQLTPILDENGNWIGEIDINLVVNQKSPLHPKDFEEVYKIQKLMSISLALFEEFSHVKELAEWSLRAQEKSVVQDNTTTKQSPVIQSGDNVITVDFNTHKKKYDA